MSAFLIEGPEGTRFSRVRLRLLAYRPAAAPLPEGHLKVVLQVVDHGHPIAEDPLAETSMPSADLDGFLLASLAEGWRFRPDGADAARRERYLLEGRCAGPRALGGVA